MRATASSPGGPGSNTQQRTFGIGSDRMVAPGSSPRHAGDTERLASRPSGGAGAGVGGGGVGVGGLGMSHSGSGQSVAAWIEEGLQDSYLSELLSYSLERLNKEPELLKAEAERVERQMQDVAVGHYRAFINAAEAVHTIRKEIADIDHHLGTMISEIPRLTSGCNEFLEEAHAVVEKRRTNRKMLANHPALLDLLEIPQLMDTCVRNGNYDEALDLEAFVSKLATMHAKLPVIQRLAQEVRQTTQAMLNQLLQRLRSNIQLPECLRIIGYLRRLAVFSEHDMRLQFLRCREAWLADVIAELDSSSPYEYIKRMTDCHRVQLFDVVTQYRAIFADDVASTSTALLDPSFGGAADDGLGGEAVVGGDGGLLYSWAMHRVSAFLRVLAEQVPRIGDGGSLASVLDHCMYCGMSLGRVGLDIRALLPPLFEVCVLRMFQRNMALAVESFEHTLETHRWVPLPPLGVGTRLSSSSDMEDVAPPYALMEHPPLAAFVNGILASLNELRHCAPLALRKPLAAALSAALADVSSSLVRYHHTRIAKESELALFIAMCKAFVEVVCPYVVTCFVRCMGSSSPAVGGPSAAAATAALVDVRSAADPIRKLITANLPPPPPPEEMTLEEEEVEATGLENDSRRGTSSGEGNSEEHASAGTAGTLEAGLANGSEAAAAGTAAEAQR